MCIFILAGDSHCSYRRMAHFSTQPSELALAELCAVRNISQTSRGIKWCEWEDEREHCLLSSSSRLCEDARSP